MKNQLAQTPTEDLFDKLFQSIYSELSKGGIQDIAMHPEKIEFKLMGRRYKIEIKEIKK